MASSTPSRPKKRSPQSGRRKASRSSTARAVSKRAAKPRKSASRTSAKRTKPTTEISPKVRQSWQQLSQRWKSLLPKLANGGSTARSKKKSTVRA